MNALCPECGNPLGELQKKYVDEGEVLADFYCTDCDHEWSTDI